MPQATDPTDPRSLIRRSRFPIDELESDAGRALVAECRARVRDTDACELEDFLTEEATAQLARDVAAVADLAHRHEGKSTPYLELPGDEWSEDHPRRRWGDYSLAALAYDRTPDSLRALYTWDALTEFVRRVLDLPEIHPYADPLGACSVAVMEDGDALNWHFDQSDFVVSIALQASTAGGDFFYTPKVRTPTDEHYAEVARVLGGDTRHVVRIPMRPGTLVLFQGRYSMHRVSAIRGETQRLVALLSYDTKPGTCASPLLQQARYGRVQRPST